MNTVRTSLLLPSPLLGRLRLVSKRKNTSVSRLVQDLVQAGLDAEEQRDLKQLYRVWDEARGVVKEPITDMSTTIDAILYGEDGAWRGTIPDSNEK